MNTTLVIVTILLNSNKNKKDERMEPKTTLHLALAVTMVHASGYQIGRSRPVRYA